MSEDIDLETRYPRQLTIADHEIVFRLMTPDDAARVLDFAGTVPRHDLLFLRRDISEPRVMDAWAREIEANHITSVLALNGDDVVGCSAVVVDPHSFSPHVGDVRVILSDSERAHGVGRRLVQESFLVALSMGLEKLTAHMTSDQDAAIQVFEDLGFRPEALLKKHVRDAEREYDLLILSHDVEHVRKQQELYGLTEAFDE